MQSVEIQTIEDKDFDSWLLASAVAGCSSTLSSSKPEFANCVFA
jgi:hypothetical protein